MVNIKLRVLFLVAFVAASTIAMVGCARSPEAKAAKYMQSGKERLAKKDYGRAMLEFKNAIQATPKNAEAYYQLGLANAAGNDLQTAVNAYRKALELDPKHKMARLRLAQLMAVAGDQYILRDAEGMLSSLLSDSEPTADTLNTLAFTELRLGKPDDAIRRLADATAKFPQELSSSVLLAQVKLASGDGKGAEEALQKLCDNLPRSADAHTILAKFYESQKRPEEAEKQLRQALTLEPNSGPALAELAKLEVSLARNGEAEQICKRLAGFEDNRYQPLYGIFLLQVGRKDEAVKEFERLTKKNPDDRTARTRLVVAYESANRSADAEKILNQALNKNSKDLDALVQRGELFLAAQQYARAEADFSEVMHLRPNSAEIRYLIAKLNQARGALLVYRQGLGEALKLNPKLLVVRLELAESFLASNNSQAALEWLNDTPDSQRDVAAVVVDRNWALWGVGDMAAMRQGIDRGLAQQRSKDLLLQDGLWKLRAGNAAGGRAALEEALKISPQDLRALSALRQSYVDQKQDVRALQKVREYAARQPKSAPVQDFLGVIEVANGDRAQARAAFTAAKMADPQFRLADLYLTQMDALEHRWADAAGRLNSILSTDPGNLTARLWLGNVEIAKGDQKAALEQFRRVVDASPGNAQALNNFAYLLAEYAKQPDQALKFAERAQELAPEKAEYADTRGWILYRKGLYPLAVKQLERAAARPGNPVWNYHLAMAYAKAGDLKRAKTCLTAALKQNPNAPEAQMARDIVEQAK